MGYLGTKPANQVIDSTLIADGTVTTSDLADNAITTAKIAAGAVIPADLSTGAPFWNTSGNVGIGTSAPGNAKLNVQGFGSYRGDAYTLASFSANSILAPLNITQLNDGTIPSISAGQNSSGTWAAGLGFMTSGTERMRIDSSGNLLVGGTSLSGINTSGGFSYSISSGQGYSVHSHINGTVSGTPYQYFFYNNSAIGSITQNGTTATAYNTSSDYRLKENIAPMTGALDTVSALKPVTYTWKADGSSGQGFIAHELQAVVPDCVTGEKDAVDAEGNPVYQGIDTSFLVATLTAAIQEQQTIITELKARIEALESK